MIAYGSIYEGIYGVEGYENTPDSPVSHYISERIYFDDQSRSVHATLLYAYCGSGHNDGIPDVVEVWFSNASIVTNLTYRQEFIQRFGQVLYNQYRWTINYFYTVKNKQNESAAEQWLSDQFNPFVVENMPPMVCLFNLRCEVEYSFSWEPVKVFAVVHLILKDVGGIHNITIRSLDTAKVFWVDTSGHNMVYDITHRFKVSVFTATFGSVRINVTAWDAAGNTLMVQKKLKGALEQVLDALAKLWSAIWDALCKVAEAVMKGLQVLLTWIMSVIETILKPVVEKISSGLIWIANEFIKVINEIIELFESDSTTASTSKDGVSILQQEGVQDYDTLLAGLLIQFMVTVPIPIFFGIMFSVQLAENVLKPFYPVFVIIPFIILGLLYTAILDAFGVHWMFGPISYTTISGINTEDPYTILDVVHQIPSDTWWNARFIYAFFGAVKSIDGFFRALSTGLPIKTALAFAFTMTAFTLYLATALVDSIFLRQIAASFGLFNAIFGLIMALHATFSSPPEQVNTPITWILSFTWAIFGVFIGFLNFCKTFNIR